MLQPSSRIFHCKQQHGEAEVRASMPMTIAQEKFEKRDCFAKKMD